MTLRKDMVDNALALGLACPHCNNLTVVLENDGDNVFVPGAYMASAYRCVGGDDSCGDGCGRTFAFVTWRVELPCMGNDFYPLGYAEWTP